jgi:magnesium transporter
MAGRVQALRIEGREVAPLSPVEPHSIQEALGDPGAVLWLDICGLQAAESEALIRQAFDFHPLAIEDALRERHSPKVDDWGSYLYLVLQGADPGRPGDTIELDIFLGPNYLVTHTVGQIPALERLWSACQADSLILKAGAAGILRRLADEMADDFLALSDSLDTDLERLETDLFEDPRPELLEDIFQLKRVSLHLSRFLAPQRDVLMKIARGDFELVPKEERVYFQDVFDHFVRLHALNESQLQLVVAARDTYLSVVNNRLNDVMKILTIITSLFMPLSFLTGFFGMNFFQAGPSFGSWTGQAAFGIAFTLMIGLPLGMFIWMKRRRWL